MKLIYLFFVAVLLLNNCQSDETTTTRFIEPPDAIEPTEGYDGVYSALDGTWEGKFKIFEDQDPGKRKVDQLTNLTLSQLEKPSLKLTQTIDVQQIYISESPTLQRVRITDRYTDNDGKEQVVKSEGVNKVEDGEMICIVNKPDETVRHSGSLVGEHTIVWQRNEQNPQKIEYFQEEVHDNLYEIIGYGYYEGDDTKKMPRLWFYGRYARAVSN
ncbi:MAG: hypothetical protein AAGI23_04785 [Bacteroidota bacterium]